MRIKYRNMKIEILEKKQRDKNIVLRVKICRHCELNIEEQRVIWFYLISKSQEKALKNNPMIYL